MRVPLAFEQTAQMTGGVVTRSNSLDAASAFGWLAAFGSALFAPIVGVVPLAVCLVLALALLVRTRVRAVGQWIAAGSVVGATVLAVCWLLLAISGPLFGA